MDAIGFILALLMLFSCILLIKYNINRQVSLSLFFTGLLQILISGYADIMTLAIMVVMGCAMLQINRLV